LDKSAPSAIRNSSFDEIPRRIGFWGATSVDVETPKTIFDNRGERSDSVVAR